MNYQGTLIAVKDIEQAKVFYQSFLELDVTVDAGEHVQLTEGIFLQTVDSWADFIHKKETEVVLENNAIELYFETKDMDAFIERLAARKDIEYLHPLLEHSWGQRAIRFYDLDKHIIEVAESIAMVVKRFIDSGMTIEEVAERTGVEPPYIKDILDKL
ncbi:glyoxalase [Enterococcus hulanensis]|uniref:Glyoxalase n=1 Tax=Enterococcus hulanensis TaxID=2559929 RepID=A0ABU3EU30_9ENTE|nr:VOC family protein [Enterococcus hulanensis]MDT2598374.1 glyoxalase [Enterococcus hulanensis]MDT2608121.1 glyoxalase [Enterococcus hulanensis]MDT2615416.1 glyoxalase [Enterococcus hulanensis]MDT2626613.1 glyoxalase [Enterococcus hulanensis]MDT2654488.1 glyoxalase [Enterococcus hulanensis]